VVACATPCLLPGGDIPVRPDLAPAVLDGDPALTERLVANLLDNAVRHNRPGGHVTVTTGTRDGAAFLAVANTGPVVPDAAVAGLFQPFQRLDETRTDGLGLGLSIVRAIATAHDATVTTTARPAGGLRVEIAFPRSWRAPIVWGQGSSACMTQWKGWSRAVRATLPDPGVDPVHVAVTCQP
jgi:signal transduction histidine kinase